MWREEGVGKKDVCMCVLHTCVSSTLVALNAAVEWTHPHLLLLLLYISLMPRRATYCRLHAMLFRSEIGERRAASVVEREAFQQRGVGAVVGGGPVVARVRGAVLRVGHQPA